jgi:hypothetical protein
MSSTKRTKGISLAKGPVGLLGLVLLAYGITALIFGGHSFVQHALNGRVHGKRWLGLEVNGWSGLLFIAAGLLLLLGAPVHWGAKGVSLIVGIALGALALIALINGHGALGIFAANHLTELVWGAAAVLLIVFSQLPRVGAKTKRLDDHGRVEPPPATRRERESSPVTRAPAPGRTGEVEPHSPSVNRASNDARGASASSVTAGSSNTVAQPDGGSDTSTGPRDIAGEDRQSASTSPGPATPTNRR